MTCDIRSLAEGAFLASTKAAQLSTRKKNDLLLKIASAVENAEDEILRANDSDVKKAADAALPSAMVDRLKLTKSRFEDMTEGILKVASLPDPVGRILDGYTVESTLRIVKRAVPLGVVGAIYEARPNVTADIAALCLKSGNACILKGGSEAAATNRAIHRVIQEVLSLEGVDPNTVTFVDSTSRDDVKELLKQDSFIDVIIPRGGEALHRFCQKESTIPVIIGGFGISHIFVDESADLIRSVPVIINSKVQKPSACNALDTLLIHKNAASRLLELLKDEVTEHKIELAVHGDDLMELVNRFNYPKELIRQGVSEDFDTEWLSLKMNVAIVSGLDEVLLHMRKHRASHSDAILTENLANAERFTSNVGSACAYVNAATRFTDGGQFGLGAEVAISTQKLHARGPVALDALTTYAYVLKGDYLSRS